MILPRCEHLFGSPSTKQGLKIGHRHGITSSQYPSLDVVLAYLACSSRLRAILEIYHDLPSYRIEIAQASFLLAKVERVCGDNNAAEELLEKAVEIFNDVSKAKALDGEKRVEHRTAETLTSKDVESLIVYDSPGVRGAWDMGGFGGGGRVEVR